jgi:Protein of unknown function (DUF4240)
LNEQQFWAIIEAGGGEQIDDRDQQLSAVRTRLGELSPIEVKEFHALFDQKMAHAYLWNLWGAAYLINGGCSDDGFAYFRAWLISRGREVYTAALQNPDSLASIVDPERDDYEFEDLWHVARMVYKEQTGEEMPAADFRWPSEPEGQHWDFDNGEAMSKRYPMLARR